MNTGKRGVRLCCCYHQEDEMYHNELVAHFAALIRQGLLDVWDPHHMLPGVIQKQEIDIHLSSSDIILLIGSRYFFNSDTHWRMMEQALELHRTGKAHIIPVQARPYDYAATPLGGLQFLPRKKPLSRLLNRDEGHVEIAEGVRQIILDLHNPRQKGNSPLDIPDEQFPEGLTLDPVAAISISDSSLFLKKGDILFKHQHYDEALTVYEDVLRLDPTCLAAYQGQARVLKKIASLAYEKLNPSTVQPSESRKPQDDAQEGRE